MVTPTSTPHGPHFAVPVLPDGPAIARTASAALERSAYAPLRRVRCTFDRGSLVLRGRLTSYFQKQLAQEAVADIAGVDQVVNQIEVIPAMGDRGATALPPARGL